MTFGMTLALLCGCSLNEVQSLLMGGTPRLPAAAYYHWAANADSETRETELAHLEALTGSDSDADAVVPRIQKAIIMQFQGEAAADSLAEINLAPSVAARCEQQPGCLDYLNFAATIKSLRAMEQRLAQREQAERLHREEARELRNEIQSLQVSLENLEQENQQLKEQIEALTVIERQLLEREQNQD